jgi:membrane protease YdiL (CAAX protease family)
MDATSSARATLSDHRIKRVFGAFGAIVGAYVTVLVFQLVLFSLSGAESTSQLQGDPMAYTAVTGLASTGFIVGALGYLWVRREWDILHVRRPTLVDAGVVIAGFVALGVASVGLSVIVEVVMSALESLFGVSSEFGQNAVIDVGRQSPTAFLYMIPVAVLIVGPGEELLFRGVVQGQLRESFGVVPGIATASLLFGLGHYFAISSGDAWTYLLIAAVMGVVLGGIYEYTENIWVPMAIHGLWNAFLFGMNYLLLVSDIPMPG